MRPDALRVVYDSRPYLVTPAEDGSLHRAYGPFTPGTEASLPDVSRDSEVTDPADGFSGNRPSAILTRSKRQRRLAHPRPERMPCSALPAPPTT